MTVGGRVTLAAPGEVRVVVDPSAGARVTTWAVGDLELVGARGWDPAEHGMYPMAPWPGRLRGNRVVVDGVAHHLPVTYAGWAMHGTVLDAPWQVVGHEQRADGARLEVAAALGAAWPWGGRVHQVYEVEADRVVTTLSVSTDGPAFPAEVGWHPWFVRRLARGGPLEVEIAASGLLERGADHLPTGVVLDPGTVPGPYDDAFVVPDGRARLTWPGALRLDLSSDVTWLVLFDELADFVCVEPQSGPPDGLGATAFVVRPGQPRTATATWRWTRL